jgi:hypothetical protein
MGPGALASSLDREQSRDDPVRRDDAILHADRKSSSDDDASEEASSDDGRTASDAERREDASNGRTSEYAFGSVLQRRRLYRLRRSG